MQTVLIYIVIFPLILAFILLLLIADVFDMIDSQLLELFPSYNPIRMFEK